MAKMFQVYGIGQALVPVLPPPLPFQSAPTSSQTNYEIGQVVYTPPHSPTAFYIYSGGGVWALFASGSGDVVAVNGTANQVTVVTAAGVATVSLPSTLIAPGSVEVTTSLTVDGVLANICNSNTDSTVTIADGSGTNATSINNGNSDETSVVNISSGSTIAATKTVNILAGANLGGTEILNLGSGTGTKTVNVGGSGTNAINIGPSGVSTVILGSASTTSTTTIRAGSGGVIINSLGNVTIDTGSNTANDGIRLMNRAYSAGTQTLDMFDGAITGGTQAIGMFSGSSSGGSQSVSIVNGTYTNGTQAVSIMSGAVSGGATQNLMLGAGSGTKTIGLGNGTGTTTLVIGSTEVASSILIQAPNTLNVASNLNFSTAGNKLTTSNIATTTTAGANSFGTVTLVGGTATISTTAVTANSKIILSRQSIGATGAAPLGILTVGTITASTSFVINAVTTAVANTLVATDVSVIFWMIVN